VIKYRYNIFSYDEAVRWLNMPGLAKRWIIKSERGELVPNSAHLPQEILDRITRCLLLKGGDYDPISWETFVSADFNNFRGVSFKVSLPHDTSFKLSRKGKNWKQINLLCIDDDF
jgi:hypothetical protein